MKSENNDLSENFENLNLMSENQKFTTTQFEFIPPLFYLLHKTWSYDLSGLFDYEKEKSNKLIISVNNTKFIRIKNEISIHKEQDENFLFEVILNNEDKYEIVSKINSNLEVTEENINLLMNKVWYVLPQFEKKPDYGKFNNPNLKIQMFDLIKIGRVQYSVNEFYYNKHIVQSDKEQVFDFTYKSFTCDTSFECRYCLNSSNEDDDNNLLVSLCKCKGGTMFIHYKCVRHWMSIKLTCLENKDKTVKSYYFNSFNCEICKEPYPCNFLT